MKILMIAPQPFFEPRGTPISIYQRLNGLSMLGHEVDLLTIHIGMDVDIPGVRIQRTMPISFIKNIPIGPSAAKLFLDILLFFKAFRVLLRNRYDAVHSHEEAAFFAMILAKIFRVPHVYDMHSSLPKQLENFKFGNGRFFIRLFKALEGAVMRSCGVAMSVGVDLEDYVKENYPTTNHIRVENTAVHNNIPVNEKKARQLRCDLGLDEDRFIVAYTGNFEQYQGIDLVLQAAQKLIEETPALAILLVGGNPEQIVQREAEVREMGLSEHVIFTGTVPLMDSLLYLHIADVLVSPRTEGLSIPLKIYSYLYAGKPTLATNIYAHTQLLTDDMAMLVDPTPQGVFDGLQQLISSAQLRHRLAENAYNFASETYSMDSYLAKLEEAYDSINVSTQVDELAPSVTKSKTRSALS
ncbi:MAG: glycosyltransferase family 4 protein [Chloroflexota bacterium]